jgi:hypothetical protein
VRAQRGDELRQDEIDGETHGAEGSRAAPSPQDPGPGQSQSPKPESASHKAPFVQVSSSSTQER